MTHVNEHSCSAEGCSRSARGKTLDGVTLCGTHYQRWKKYGSTSLPARTKYQTCSACDCSKKTRSSGSPYCETHYYRMRRTGTVDLLDPERLITDPADKRGYVGRRGYVLVSAPGHPLSMKSGVALKHRLVYWRRYGEGPFSCNWCGEPVTWKTLHIDHVNAIRTDNRLDNLVASCARCNKARGAAKMRETHRAKNRRYEYRGSLLCLTELAEIAGICIPSVVARLSRGMSVAQAVETPRGPNGPK